jgi:hypothetical protein
VSESRVVVGSVSAEIMRVRVRARARTRARLVMVMMGQLFLLTCIERAVFNGEAAVVVVIVVVIVVGHDDGCEEEASAVVSNEKQGAVLHHIHSTVLPVGQIDAVGL